MLTFTHCRNHSHARSLPPVACFESQKCTWIFHKSRERLNNYAGVELKDWAGCGHNNGNEKYTHSRSWWIQWDAEGMNKNRWWQQDVLCCSSEHRDVIWRIAWPSTNPSILREERIEEYTYCAMNTMRTNLRLFRWYISPSLGLTGPDQTPKPKHRFKWRRWGETS